ILENEMFSSYSVYNIVNFLTSLSQQKIYHILFGDTFTHNLDHS
ncbi:hypothetical protein AZZ82_000493, partial [Klebsiella aerogenes]